MSALRRRTALSAIVSDESRVSPVPAWILSRVGLLRWRDDDQLRNHSVSYTCCLLAFTLDAGNVACRAGVENSCVDGRCDHDFVATGAGHARIVAGFRLLDRTVDAADGCAD